MILIRTGVLAALRLSDMHKLLVVGVIVRALERRVNSQVRYLKIEWSGRLVILDDLQRLVREEISRVSVGSSVSRNVAAVHIVAAHVLAK